MPAILGLTSSKTFDDNGFYSLNDRRQVFHEYPNGAAPLTGLLSLMETEPTDNPKFGWFEKRFKTPKTQINAAAAPFSTGGGDVAKANPFTATAADSIRVVVDDTAEFRVRDVIWLKDLPVSGGVVQLQGIITAIPTSTKIDFTVIETVAGIVNSTAATPTGPGDSWLIVVGTASAEGSISSGSGVFYPPVNPENFTQIFRTPFAFTGTGLKIPANFDKTGIYKEKAKDSCLDHMVKMEKAFLFGQKGIQNIADPTTGDTVPLRTTGGLHWWLQQYEKANGGAYELRPGGAALTADSDDEKRIIRNTSGTMTWAVFNSYVERAFRRTNNKSFEKIVFCGSKALAALNTVIESRVTTNKNFGAENTYGMNVVSIETVHGILHFKSHPLFTEHPSFEKAMMITDVGNLRYRPLNDRDTVINDNIQANDLDGRKDEWFSEAGMEVRFPESNMLIQNVGAITVS